MSVMVMVMMMIVSMLIYVQTSVMGDFNLRAAKAGDVVQLERKGFYRVDRAFGADRDDPNSAAVLFYIPDGRPTKPLAERVSAAH